MTFAYRLLVLARVRRLHDPAIL